MIVITNLIMSISLSIFLFRLIGNMLSFELKFAICMILELILFGLFTISNKLDNIEKKLDKLKKENEDENIK